MIEDKLKFTKQEISNSKIPSVIPVQSEEQGEIVLVSLFAFPWKYYLPSPFYPLDNVSNLFLSGILKSSVRIRGFTFVH